MSEANNVVDYERIYQNFSVKDASNPFSLINIAPGFIVDQIKSMPESLFEMPEDELISNVNPDSILKKLRTSFGLEYCRAVRRADNMNAANIYSGIVQMHLFRKICTSNAKLAYIMMPRPDYNVELEDLLFVATDEMRKALEAPTTITKLSRDSDGRMQFITVEDSKLIAIKMKIFEYLSSRRRGQMAQKIQTENKHIHAQLERPLTPAEVDKKIMELENKLQPGMIEAPHEKTIELIKAKEET